MDVPDDQLPFHCCREDLREIQMKDGLAKLAHELVESLRVKRQITGEGSVTNMKPSIYQHLACVNITYSRKN